MKVQDVARTVMKITHTTQQEIADKAGLAGQGTVGMYLNSKSMRVDSLLTILNNCGYELIARSVDGSNPEFVIGEESEHKSAAGMVEEDRLREMIQTMIAEEIGKAPTQDVKRKGVRKNAV